MGDPLVLALGFLSLALSIVIYLGKKEINRLLEMAERMPKKEWFDAIQIKIDQFPTLKRLEDHFDASHKHATLLTSHQLKIESMDTELDDHETRIRVIETKVK